MRKKNISETWVFPVTTLWAQLRCQLQLGMNTVQSLELEDSIPLRTAPWLRERWNPIPFPRLCTSEKLLRSIISLDVNPPPLRYATISPYLERGAELEFVGAPTSHCVWCHLEGRERRCEGKQQCDGGTCRCYQTICPVKPGSRLTCFTSLCIVLSSGLLHVPDFA
jgi:hypothetical protein